MGKKKVWISLGPVSDKPRRTFEKGMGIMAFQLKDSQQLPLAVASMDSEGNPAPIAVAYASTDPTIVAVTDNGDGTALAVASPGEGGLGTATVTATATGTNGEALVGSLDIEVVAGDAVVINIVPGAAEDKPTA